MNFLKNIFLYLLLSVTLFTACSDSDDTDGNFLCLPHTIDNINLEYDSNQRIVKITHTLTSALTYSSFDYDAQGNLLEIRSYVAEDVQTTRRFSYSGQQVSIAISNVEAKDSTILIELNDKQQAIKRSNNKSASTLSYDYDLSGNIVKTTNEKDSINNFTYDTKRGIFREVNMPQWFLNAVIGDLFGANMSEHLAVYNNCTSIRTTKYTAPAKEGEEGKTAEVILKSYVHKYNGFNYPYSITDKNLLTSVISYKTIE